MTLETGPKGKKAVAVAADWPGWERGAKTADAAVEALESYRERYAKVAGLAGLEREFAALGGTEVIERYVGTGSTDFWGISFGFSTIDRQSVSTKDLERELRLLRACWATFDDVRRRVSAEMRKGSRGGGRDRDRIVLHVLAVEQDWATKLGVRAGEKTVVTDDAGLNRYRDAYCDAIRSFAAEGKTARTWPLRYLIRHTAYHALDHAWEMEDKDLSGTAA